MAVLALSLHASETNFDGQIPARPLVLDFPLVTNVAQLRQAVNDGVDSICAFCLEGTVLAADSGSGLIFFQDDSGTEILETSIAGRQLLPGQRIQLRGTNYVVSTGTGVSLGKRPVVDNDGRHPEAESTATVNLRTGRYPIQVLWFNYTGDWFLKVEYSGPGLARQTIPNSALFCPAQAPLGGGAGLANGLNYRCFEGDWQNVPPVETLTPVKTGITPNFDVTVKSRNEHVGLAFDGFIEVERNGLYTFYVRSDDGSQLFLINPPTQLTMKGAGKVPAPRKIVIRQPLSDKSGPFWAEVEGTVTFVGRQQTGTELELTSEDTQMRVTVCTDSQEPPRYLLGSLLRVRGICLDTSNNEKYWSADTLVVSGWKSVQVLDVAPEFWSESKRLKIGECKLMNREAAARIVRICGRLRSRAAGELPDLEDGTGSIPIELLDSPPSLSDDEIECLGRWSQIGSNSILSEAVWHELPKKTENKDNTPPLLTTAAQVQQLNREEAGRGYHAKIKGVVVWISENRDCVIIQDLTRGVFVGLRSAWIWDTPKIGEILDIEGTCVAGDFSPIVILDKAKRLGMGRLPAPMHPTRDQLIRGSMDSQYVEIRGLVTGTHDNHLALLMSGGKVDVELDPNPTDSLVSFVNSVVRIRGCMFAKWEYPTLQVDTDHPLWFDNATICMDTPAPLDPFDAHKMQAKALMRFDVQGNIFRRVKIAGQILCGDEKMHYMTEDGFGLRFELVQPVKLEPGDEAEVVGLAELGGPSPVLREAIARKTGHGPLPAPQPLALDGTNITYDSTRVWVEGILVDYQNHGAEQVLELQVGVKNFIARLISQHPPAKTWPLGSRLKMTGVFCALDGSPMAGRNVNSFELLLNSPKDVQVIAWPPWWTPRRALTIVAVLSGVLGIALIWIKLLRKTVEERSAQLQKQIEERQSVEQRRIMEQERTRVAQDLHDELGAGLTEMGLLGDLVKNPSMPAPEKQQYLGQLTDTARSLVTSLDEIVWAVNPRYDSVASVASYCTLFAQRFLDLAGVACRPHIPASFPEFPLDPKERHSVFLAFREALNNVVRHSGATEVRLIIEVSEGKLIILVADNGHGFDLATKSSGGEGIQGMRHRLEHLGGDCDIRSRPGAGTEVDLRLPLKNHAL